MAEARKIQVPVLKPPPRYELLLTEEEAIVLKELLGCIGGRGTPSAPLYLSPCHQLNVSEEEFYSGPRKPLSSIYTSLQNAQGG